MDLVATIRGTGSVREFTDESVDDEVVARIAQEVDTRTDLIA